MKSQYQQQGKAGLTPSQEGKFNLGVSWLRKGRWGLVSALKSALVSSIPFHKSVVLWLLFSSAFQ